MTAREILDGYLERGVITHREHQVKAMYEHPRHPMSYREIALALDITFSTVRDTLKRAEKKIERHNRLQEAA